VEACAVAKPEQPESDEWSEWLLHRRHADDPSYGIVVQGLVLGFADKVLDDANLASGMTLVDIGAGEGLLAFRAIERFGQMNVILTDISGPMLRYAEAVAARRHIRGQCTFLECSADNLRGIADASVDAVVARAAVAYVTDKIAAFAEFQRILKPGGQISIAEPIMQDEAFLARALRVRLAQTTPLQDPFLPLLHRWKSAQFPDTEDGCAKSPIVNFSERNLVNFANGAGFTDIHLQFHINVAPSPITSWEVFLGTSPHPWAPSLSTILAEQFSAQERALFETVVRPQVESGRNLSTDRVAYLTARKAA
jgi:arsenite methyltransferase